MLNVRNQQAGPIADLAIMVGKCFDCSFTINVKRKDEAQREKRKEKKRK